MGRAVCPVAAGRHRSTYPGLNSIPSLVGDPRKKFGRAHDFENRANSALKAWSRASTEFCATRIAGKLALAETRSAKLGPIFQAVRTTAHGSARILENIPQTLLRSSP